MIVVSVSAKLKNTRPEKVVQVLFSYQLEYDFLFIALFFRATFFEL